MRDLSQIHVVFIKSGQIQDTLAAAKILRFSATSDLLHRDLDYAYKIFNHMHSRNCFSWNTIIRGFSESDEDKAEFAITLFCEMMNDELVEPNRFSFLSVLKACAKTGKIQEGKQIHGLGLKLGLSSDEFVMSNLVRVYVMCGLMIDRRKRDGEVVMWNVMIDGYMRLSDCKAARMLFDKMRQRSVISWNTMIFGYSQNEYFKDGVSVMISSELYRSILINY